MQKAAFPSLTPFFTTATHRIFSTGPAQARKQSATTKTCFSFKIKDQIILFELAGILKNILRFFKLDSETLLVCHSAVTLTKWQNMKANPTLTPLEDIVFIYNFTGLCLWSYLHYLLISCKLMVGKILTVSLVICETCTEQLI